MSDRYSLYSQNVNLYLAPTADARDTWGPLMQTIGFESRAFVLSANQCMRTKNLPPWIKGKAPSAPSDKTSNGSSASGRRLSTDIAIDENHEATWLRSERIEVEPSSTNGATLNGKDSAVVDEENPNAERPTPTRRRKSTITRTEDNHEIVLPAVGNPAKPDQASISDEDDEFVSRGGSCIIGPMGNILAGPLWEVEDGGFLSVEVDFEDCERGRLDLDVAGSYSRNDAFKLIVEGLDINPPP